VRHHASYSKASRARPIQIPHQNCGMSQPRPPPQNALRNIPRVVVRPTWENAVACFYLPKAVVFFVAHPFLYPLLRARLLPAVLLSLFIITNLFVWTYIPQVLFLRIFQSHGSAWVNGSFLVLGESAAVVAILFESFLVVGLGRCKARSIC
jgi:hypothetical protein